GLRRTIFFEEDNSLIVQTIDLDAFVFGPPCNGRDGFAFHDVVIGLVDDGIRSHLGGERIKATGTVRVAVELSHVSEIIKRERIVRVDQIGFVKQLLRLRIIMLLDGLNAIAIQRLHWSVLAALGNRDAQIASEKRCSEQQYEKS